MVIDKKKIILIVLSALILSACGSGYGIYHRVKPGETLEGIGSAYGVSKGTLLKSNHLDGTYHAKTGDAIWVPGAEKQVSAKSARSLYGKETRTGSNKTAVNQKKYTKKRSNRKKAPQSFPDVDVAFSWPLQGEAISQYGNKNGERHDGIDIAGQLGDEVRSAASGRVIYSGNEIKGYGNMIIVKHEGSYSTVYAHNSDNLVKKDAFVKKGEVIARVGQSGRIAMPALHFELRKGKKAVNPLEYLQ